MDLAAGFFASTLTSDSLWVAERVNIDADTVSTAKQNASILTRDVAVDVQAVSSTKVICASCISETYGPFSIQIRLWNLLPNALFSIALSVHESSGWRKAGNAIATESPSNSSSMVSIVEMLIASGTSIEYAPNWSSATVVQPIVRSFASTVSIVVVQCMRRSQIVVCVDLIT